MKCVVSGLVLADDQILLVKNKHLERDDNDFWSMPGGKVESGESLRSALKREMLEETGVKSEIGELLFINEYKLDDGSFAGPNFIFAINNPEDFIGADFSKASHSFELNDIKFMPLNGDANIQPHWLTNELQNISPGSTAKLISDAK